jgi:hypothetical protein
MVKDVGAAGHFLIRIWEFSLAEEGVWQMAAQKWSHYGKRKRQPEIQRNMDCTKG